MNRIISYSASLLAVAALAGCAVEPSESSGVSAKAYFDAWMQINHPEAEPTELGTYVIENEEGSGALVGDEEQSPYLLVRYIVSGLDGNISNTSEESVAQQLGTYDPSYFYGPRVWARVDGNTLYAGVEDAVRTMRVGGRRKTVIPGWLMTTSRYDSPQDYINNVSGSNSIYDITVEGVVEDIEKWELDALAAYVQSHFSKEKDDTLKYGLYYVQHKKPGPDDDDTVAFATDSTVYINYIGRRLDGQVFDTNIRDTAKRYDIFSSSSEYEPVAVTWNKDDYKELKMGASSGSSGSSMIDGFAYALWKMRGHEAGTCIFYSGLGYGSSGSGSRIPEYSPLQFYIEIVDKEED